MELLPAIVEKKLIEKLIKAAKMEISIASEGLPLARMHMRTSKTQYKAR
tara:strand:- start:503 stop:649 length:147 start_codon:yes stop_codon:yes gene_type:complete